MRWVALGVDYEMYGKDLTDSGVLSGRIAKILGGLSDAPAMSMWWSVVFGANLGGNLTPIGSASTVVAVTVMHRAGLSLKVTRLRPLGLIKG